MRSRPARPKLQRVAIVAVACAACSGSPAESVGPPRSAPTVSLTISAPRVRAVTGSITLTWSSQNAATCSASGGWNGSQPTSGQSVLQPLVVGQYAYALTCTGSGGSASASAALEVWQPLPVLPTSYANFKNVGIGTTMLPYTAPIRGYADFYQDGSRALFTAQQTYDRNKPIDQATGAVYQFWRMTNGEWKVDNSLLVPPSTTCLHPRNALVADFNGDGRPDVFLACYGYDAPPFPGERNQVVLSSPNGTYSVSDASPDVLNSHGAAAGDMNGDGKVDVILATGHRPLVYLNDGSGRFTRESTDRFAALLPEAPWWTVQVTDVNEDGLLDVLVGGTEWVDCPTCTNCPTCMTAAPTTVLLATASGSYDTVRLPAVLGEGLVLDFVVTGTGVGRAIWVNRTTGAAGVPSYAGRTLQRVAWNGLQSTVAYTSHAENWVEWLMALTVNGGLYIGSDNSRDNFGRIFVP